MRLRLELENLLIKTKNHDGVKHVILSDAQIQSEQISDGVHRNTLPNNVLFNKLELYYSTESLDSKRLLLEDQRVPFQSGSDLRLHVPQG